MSDIRSHSQEKQHSLCAEGSGTDLDSRYASMLEAEKLKAMSAPDYTAPPTFDAGKSWSFDEMQAYKQNSHMYEENIALRQRLRLLTANSTLRAANVVAELLTWIDDYDVKKSCASGEGNEVNASGNNAESEFKTTVLNSVEATRCSSPNGFHSRKHSKSPSGYHSFDDTVPYKLMNHGDRSPSDHRSMSTSPHNSRHCSPDRKGRNTHKEVMDDSQLNQGQNNSRSHSPSITRSPVSSTHNSRRPTPNATSSFTFTVINDNCEYYTSSNGTSFDMAIPTFNTSKQCTNDQHSIHDSSLFSPNEEKHEYSASSNIDRKKNHSSTFGQALKDKSTSQSHKSGNNNNRKRSPVSVTSSSPFSPVRKDTSDYISSGFGKNPYKIDTPGSSRSLSPVEDTDRKAKPYKVESPVSSRCQSLSGSRKANSSYSNSSGCKFNYIESSESSESSFELKRKPSPRSVNCSSPVGERLSLRDLDNSPRYSKLDSRSVYLPKNRRRKSKSPCPVHGNSSKSPLQTGSQRLPCNWQSRSCHVGRKSHDNDLDLKQLKEAAINAKRHALVAEPSLHLSYLSDEEKKRIKYQSQDILGRYDSSKKSSLFEGKDYNNKQECSPWQKSRYGSSYAYDDTDAKSDPIFLSYLQSNREKHKADPVLQSTSPDKVSDFTRNTPSCPGSITPTFMKCRNQFDQSRLDKEYMQKSAEFKESLMSLAFRDDADVKLKATTRLIGEICFQLDRKILNFVFKLNSENKKRRRFYGYIIQNIVEKINRECTDKKSQWVDDTKKHMLQCRYLYILKTLKPLGYNVTYHPDFCADMVNKYGLLPLPPERNNSEGIKPEHKEIVLDTLLKVTPHDELRNIAIVLDCLTQMARDDNTSIISF